MTQDAGVTRQPPFLLFLLLAWAAAAAQLAGDGWAASAVTLPDADDAMRLVQLRAWLGGQGWYDLHVARLAPPGGYELHWSRLIDAGLAGLMTAFRLVVDAPAAERLMLVLWPMLWLLPAIGAVAAIAWRIGEREAALAALLLAAFSMPAFQQFRPGRIDHHNLHLALALLAVASASWSDRWRPGGWVTGLLTGFALAIGFESLPFVMVAGAALALRYVATPHGAATLRAYGLAAAAATLAAFLVSVGPDRWLVSVCDGIAVNSMTAAVAGALALAFAARRGASSTVARGAAVAAAGVAALLVFAAFEPRCLAGPYALVDPAIGPVWIDHVAEVQTLARMVRESLHTGFATLAYPVVVAAALAVLAVQPSRRRDFGTLVVAGAALIAIAMTLAVVKAYSYAVWFGLPLVAAALGVLFARWRVTGLVPRFAVLLLLTPTAVTLAAMGAASALGARPLALDTPERQACVHKNNVQALAGLPPGVIVTNELEWGPYLLAWTPHSVLAAPYHRLSPAIVASHRAFAQPPAAARETIAKAGIDYVVTCGTRGPLGLNDAATRASLWGHLRTGDRPGWLEPVILPVGQPFSVYRVLR